MSSKLSFLSMCQAPPDKFLLCHSATLLTPWNPQFCEQNWKSFSYPLATYASHESSPLRLELFLSAGGGLSSSPPLLCLNFYAIIKQLFPLL